MSNVTLMVFKEVCKEIDVHKEDVKLFLLYYLFTDNIQHG